MQHSECNEHGGWPGAGDVSRARIEIPIEISIEIPGARYPDCDPRRAPTAIPAARPRMCEGGDGFRAHVNPFTFRAQRSRAARRIV
jgi:hypothetical protein